MKKAEEVVVVTNFPDEFAAHEDKKLSEAFSVHLPSRLQDVKTLHRFDLRDTCVYAFRCIYGESGTVETNLFDIYRDLDERGIRYINKFNGKGDQKGKEYLVELCALGYPVVPTASTAPAAIPYGAKEYIVKPAFGGSSKGQRVVPHDALETFAMPRNSVIQPKLDVSYETSYIFVDNEFEYAVKTRKERWDLVFHEPMPDELALVKHLVEWNPIKGIQRVDCVWTISGEQLVLELEDWCPFLSLFDTVGTPKDKVIFDILVSLGAL